MRSSANLRAVLSESQNMQTDDMTIPKQILTQNGHSMSFGVTEKPLNDYVSLYVKARKI